MGGDKYTDVNQKMVIVLGGGLSQLPIVEAVRRCNFQVIVVDQNKFCASVDIADIFWNISIWDFDAIAKKLHKFIGSRKVEIVGLIARTGGPSLEVMSKLNALLGLPGPDKQFTEICNSKSKTREYCLTQSIPVPRGYKFDGTFIAAPGFDGPYVIRPDVTLVGKKDVFLCEENSNFLWCVKQAMLASGNSNADIAAFKNGRDITALYAFDAGNVYFLSAWEEKNQFERYDLSGACTLSVEEPVVSIDICEKFISDIIGFAQKIANDQPNLIHPVAISWRLGSDGSIYLIEIHLDLTGDDLLDKILPEFYGKNLIDPLVAWMVHRDELNLLKLLDSFN